MPGHRPSSGDVAIATSLALILSAGSCGDRVGVSNALPADTTGTANAVVAECKTPKHEWIWCDDFEQDRLSSYFEVSNPAGAFARTGGAGLASSQGMRAHYSKGVESAGNLKLAFGRTPNSYMRPVGAGSANFREVYWRVYVRTDPATWSGKGGFKFTRAVVLSNANWAEAMAAHLWTGESTAVLTLDPASGTTTSGALQTTTYNDLGKFRWLGATAGGTPIFDVAHRGTWYCVEAHVRLNDANASNGIFEFWIANVLQARRADLNWVGAYSAYGINAVFLENFWNGGADKDQERYFDNFIVSTARIGC